MWGDFPPFCVLGFSAILRFRIWGDFPPFLVLGFGVIFRRSAVPSFRHSSFQGRPGEAKYTQAKLAAFEPPCKVEIVTYKRVTHYTHVRHHARPAILPHDVHAAGDFRVRSHVFIARQK